MKKGHRVRAKSDLDTLKHILEIFEDNYWERDDMSYNWSFNYGIVIDYFWTNGMDRELAYVIDHADAISEYILGQNANDKKRWSCGYVHSR